MVDALAWPKSRGGQTLTRTAVVEFPVSGRTLRTTAIFQEYLNDLNGGAPVKPIIRELLARAANRLYVVCSSMLARDYRRLTRPPLNLQPSELLSGVVERLLKAMERTFPTSVRQFFGLVNQHIRWELNDVARRLDDRMRTAELRDEFLPSPESSGAGLSPNTLRILEAIESLPEEQREAFELVRIQGMMPFEVAKIIGVSERTVQRRLNRGLVHLTRMLEDLRPAVSRCTGRPKKDSVLSGLVSTLRPIQSAWSVCKILTPASTSVVGAVDHDRQT